MVRYSVVDIDSEKTARAYGYEFHCSPKHSMNIARAIKGMKLSEAKSYLKDIIALKRPVPFTIHKRKVSHRKGIGPGAYPRRAAKYILRLLENVENNAEYKGMDPENMVISHISAYYGREIEGMIFRAHGRTTESNEQTTNIEIIIEEVE